VKPTIRRRAAIATTALAVLVALTLAPDPAAARRPPSTLKPIVKTTQVAPGLTFTRIVERQRPRRTFVLAADLSKPLTFDVTLARTALPGAAKTSEIAKRAGALAAVNGDFSVLHAGRPVHPFAFDGQLAQSGPIGPAFAVSRDERHVFVDRPQIAITVTDTSSGRVFRLDRWNQGPPAPGEIAGYSPVGGTLEVPPDHACSVRLVPTGPAAPSSGSDGVDQDFTVGETACAESPMTRDGGVVLSAPPSTDEATQLLALAPGTPMHLHWTLGWPDVYDSVGGGPLLVADGQIAVSADCATSFCRANPRTGIGVTANGRILLVVVDGRKPKWSVGPTIFGFARIMQAQGAVWALNLDGGGSTTMVVNGEVVNRPSDGFERSVSNAVVILPGPDPGEA
jgi:hypothetical protein